MEKMTSMFCAKAEVSKVEEIEQALKQFATCEDLTRLYNTVTPSLKTSEQQMVRFMDEMDKFRQVMKHTDELLTCKVNKQTFYELENNIPRTYVRIAEVDEIKQDHSSYALQTDDEIKKLKDMIE